MKQSLQVKLGQGLTMTPQLQQALRLLQLSSLELSLEIREALDSNMMLELDEDDAGAPAGPADEAEPADTELNGAEYAESFEPDDIPEDLPVDTAWEDIYDSASHYSRAASAAGYGDDECRDHRQDNLRGHLLWQLNLTTLSPTDKLIAIALIDAINDDGYLETDPEELQAVLSADLDVETEEIEAVLRVIQALEPVGVGARNLAECLELQLAQLDPGTPWINEARQLVCRHIQLLGAHDYKKLMRRMKLGRDELRQVIELIQSMHPRPGGQVQQTHTEYVIPDVVVKKSGGAWKVELNTEAVPRLRINTDYARMVGRAEHASLKDHLQEARWFIKSLQSRSETLLRVATGIVERQRAFLEHGDEAMKPLVLHDIAERLGMHDSTVSRVTAGKYMHTPRGVFELRYFFSSHVATDRGGACSSTAVRALIRKLVLAEQPGEPLSDSKIAGLLAGQGIQVARRTVAKYREALSIPPSNERKRLA